MKIVKKVCFSCVIIVVSLTAQAMEQEQESKKNFKLSQKQEQWIVDTLNKFTYLQNQSKKIEIETELITDLISARIDPNYIFQHLTYLDTKKQFPTYFKKNKLSLINYSIRAGATNLFKTLVSMESANINIKNGLGSTPLKTVLSPDTTLTFQQRQEILSILFAKGAKQDDALFTLRKHRNNKKFAKTRNALASFIKNPFISKRGVSLTMA
jgi:hypothetical protein